MGLETASTLTFTNVKGDLLLGSLNCSTFSRICAKIYESDEGLWVKGEKSFDIACTDITCHHGINRGGMFLYRLNSLKDVDGGGGGGDNLSVPPFKN